MSIKSFLRWFVGDTDGPLGPESERGLFNHFNRPESLPWPPADGPIVGNRPKQFRPPVSDRGGDMVPCPAHLTLTGLEECNLCGSFGYVTRDMAKRYWDRNDRPVPKLIIPDEIARNPRYQAPKPLAPEPRELMPTVGSILVPTLDGPPQRVPICHRPQRVEEAVFAGNIHPDLYEYIVHLEAHYARTAHHGK